MEEIVMIKSEILKIEDFFNLVKEGGKYQIYTKDGWQEIGDVYLKNNKIKKEVKFNSGYSIIASEDHLFEIQTIEYDENSEIFDRIEILDNSFWIKSKNLKRGDKIISKNGFEEVIDIIEKGIGKTYDLEVLHKNHQYWSGELSSHNTGKSAIAEGLAQRIIERKVSRVLFNKRVVMLDLASMVAGTKYRGQFEERIKALMAELEKEPNVILFIDEIHTMIGAGGASGSMDASNMFKPALARGEMQVIGATTIDEYRRHIEKDGALERRFQKVMVEPASREESLEIIGNIKDRYEDHHNVTYTSEAIKACVDLTERYMADRFLPDKAIDALDEAGARVHISNIIVPKEITDLEQKIIDVREKKVEVIRSQRYEEAASLRDVERELNEALDKARDEWEEVCKKNRQVVTEDNVAEVVSMMTGIPVQKVSEGENTKLAKMEESLKGKVIGQDEAIKKVVKAIQRGRVGMKDPNKPVLVAMCIGSSGSGKTELAKQIAKYMFDSEDSMIRIDMSEYMEKIAINRIIGSPSGYVGYEDSNLLDQIRRKPYSVILMDEIEKAHSDVYNIFLQAFDDGHMTDSHGRKVSFKNCIILMTSNVGTKVVKDFGTGVGFSTKSKTEDRSDEIKSILEKELKKKFSPEFINRIEEIIYFNDLTRDDIKKILSIELDKSLNRLKLLGFGAELDDSIIDKLIEVGYDPQYGARPLKRAIQKWIDDYVTEFIISNNPKEGTQLFISYDSELDSTVVSEVSNKYIKKKYKKGDE
jgi:ATP-dependent Clp protease ATP-binding subunit ClpC